MKMLSSKLKAIILPFLLSGCIGTDLLDDETRPEILEIDLPDDDVVSLLVGQNQQLTFSYFNEFGVAEDVEPTYSVEDPNVATVSINGTVLALSSGQTHVMIMIEGVMSAPVPINVSETANDVNKVLIESPKEVLQLGETIQLVATAWNVAGELVENTEASWQVDNQNIALVNNEGRLAAISNGEVFVIATINGVESEPFLVQVGSSSRTASFEGRSGYNAVGMATLFVAENGDIMLELSDDFDTDFALGTFIYLSNSTSGSATRSAGLEISEIKSGGAALFNVSEIDADVTLSTFRYVIVLCKPASIPFGVADLNL